MNRNTEVYSKKSIIFFLGILFFLHPFFSEDNSQIPQIQHTDANNPEYTAIASTISSQDGHETQNDDKIQNFSPAELSDNLFSFFMEEGLQPQRQLLLNSLSTYFPYNITLTFAGGNTDETSEDTLIIAISESDAYLYKKNIVKLAKTILDSPPSCEVQILLTANDKSGLPTGLSKNMPAGIKTAVESMTGLNAAIIISSPEQNKTSAASFSRTKKQAVLFTGANGTLAPRSMIQVVSDSLENASIPYDLYGGFFLLYRLNLLRVSDRLEELTRDGIPSVEITCADTSVASNVFELLPDILQTISSSGVPDSMHDVNYMKFGLGKFSFWISESIFLLIAVSSTAGALLLLFMFSFWSIKKKKQNLHDFAKSWYLIPLLILFTGFFLTLGQKFASLIITDLQQNLPAIFIIKLLFSFLFVILFVIFRQFMNLPINQFIYGYMLTLISFINIFIFSIVYLPLCFVFAIEYLLAYIFRPAKRIWSLLLAVICMGLPYFVILYCFLIYGEPELLLKFAVCSFSGNLLTACLLIPFQIMLIRIFIHLKFFGKLYYYTPGRFILDFSFALGGIILSFLICILFVRFSQKTATVEERQTIQSKNIDIELSGKKTEYLDISTYIIQIKSERQAIRYDIQLITDADKFIYTTDFPYERQNGNTAVFSLDEYPEKNLFFSFSTSPDTNCTLKVQAYIDSESLFIPIETTELTFESGFREVQP